MQSQLQISSNISTTEDQCKVVHSHLPFDDSKAPKMIQSRDLGIVKKSAEQKVSYDIETVLLHCHLNVL